MIHRYRLFIYLALFANLALFGYSLYNRPPDADDAWIGEHAYWQAKTGHVKSELMRGITRQEEIVLCHHKLLTLQGAMFISLFGFSVYTLKSVALVYLLIFTIIFYAYTRLERFSKEEAYLALLFLFSNAMVFQFAFVYRPEIPLMTLGFVSYIFLEKSIQEENKSSFLFVVLSGLFSGLALSTHLNGVIFIGAGLVLLLWNRKFVHLLFFAIGTIPTALIYFYDFTSQYNLQFWYYQISQSPMIDHASTYPFGVYYIRNFFNEHMRFFHSPKEVIFTLLIVLTLTMTFKRLKGYTNMLRYLLLLILFLAIVAVHKTSKYALLYLPYFIIIVTASINEIFKEENGTYLYFGRISWKRLRLPVVLVLAGYFTINTFINFMFSLEKWTPENNRNLVTHYIGKDVHNVRVVAPITFIFDEIPHFKSIQSDLSFAELQNHDTTIYRKKFLDEARIYRNNYILLEGNSIKEFGFETYPDQDIQREGFKILLRDSTRILLKDTLR